MVIENTFVVFENIRRLGGYPFQEFIGASVFSASEFVDVFSRYFFVFSTLDFKSVLYVGRACFLTIFNTILNCIKKGRCLN